MVTTAPVTSTENSGLPGIHSRPTSFLASELRKLLASAPVGLALVDRNRKVVDINNRLPGQDDTHQAARGPEDLQFSLVSQLLPYVDTVFRTSKQMTDIQLMTTGEKEETNYWLTSFVPVRGPSDRIDFVGCYVQDITESERAKECLKNHDRRMDEHLTMLGHELRNPLAALVNATDLLRFVHSEDQELEEVKDVLSRQTSCMKAMIDGLLDITRISSGKIVISKQLVNLPGLLKEVLADQRPEAKRLGVTLSYAGPSEALWTHADRTRLLQIFDNIISNALKFTPFGGKVCVDLSSNKDEVVIAVKDTGVGIAPELINKVFEPFSQGKQSIDRSLGGLGLGLALARGLVELHKGSISVTSEGIGQGSKFTVRLPRTHYVGDSLKDQRESLALRPRKILVVEDNMDAAVLLKRILTKCGQSVELVHNGKDALVAVESVNPDLVLCDIGLPGDLDGYDIVKQLRALPGFSSKPMIAVTGYGLKEDVDRALSAGFDRHMTKPINFSMLRTLLQEL